VLGGLLVVVVMVVVMGFDGVGGLKRGWCGLMYKFDI